MKLRYFVSNAKGMSLVRDRQIHNTVVATCTYREQAQLVMLALNMFEESKTAHVPLTGTPPLEPFHG